MVGWVGGWGPGRRGVCALRQEAATAAGPGSRNSTRMVLHASSSHASASFACRIPSPTACVCVCNHVSSPLAHPLHRDLPPPPQPRPSAYPTPRRPPCPALWDLPPPPPLDPPLHSTPYTNSDLENGLEQGLSRPVLAPDVVAPDVDQQHVSHRQREQRALPFKICIVLAALAPVTALQVHHQRHNLRDLRRAAHPDALGGLAAAAHGVHHPEVGAELGTAAGRCAHVCGGGGEGEVGNQSRGWGRAPTRQKDGRARNYHLPPPAPLAPLLTTWLSSVLLPELCGPMIATTW